MKKDLKEAQVSEVETQPTQPKASVMTLRSAEDKTVSSLHPAEVATGVTVPEGYIGVLRFAPEGDVNKTKRLLVGQHMFIPGESVVLKIGIGMANVAYRVSKGSFLGHLALIPV
jgi:hypothetical protein